MLANGIVGISHSWWMSKPAGTTRIRTRWARPRHRARHGVVPTGERRDPTWDPRLITRRQGYLFFPLLLEGLNLHVKSVRSLGGRGRIEGRWLELGLMSVRFAVYLGLVFWVLPFGMAAAFVGVELAVFGLYMGATFAPNHKGMPIGPRDAKLAFLSKQVRTSRNIVGGWWATALMGGLNHQVEHHLFPNSPGLICGPPGSGSASTAANSTSPTPRPRSLRPTGASSGISTTSGSRPRDPFACPLAQTLRPS